MTPRFIRRLERYPVVGYTLLGLVAFSFVCGLVRLAISI
jgi:hypothetical protein